MDFSSICRACLATKYLNPIFEEGEDHDTFTTTVFITTGLKVDINDGLPQKMCKNCLKFIKDALEFRQLCKDVETQLLSIKNHRENYENDIKKFEIQKPNRKIKKSKDNSFINVKIESKLEYEDDVPLLQQILRVREQRNVKMETEFLKIDGLNDKFAKQKIEGPENYIEFDGVKKNNCSQVEIEYVDIKNDSEVLNYGGREKNNENEQNIEFDNDKTKLDISESEDSILDETKFETEFLDMAFDSDADENLATEIEITEYNEKVPYQDMQLNTKYNSVIPHKAEISEYNIELDNNDIVNYNLVNDCNTEYLIKKGKIKKLRKTTKDLNMNQKQDIDISFVNNRQIEGNPQNITDTTPSMKEILINLEKDDKNVPILDDITENMPYIIQDRNRVTCKLCQKDLSKRSIYTHMAKSHPGADSRKTKCELCDMYVLKERVKKHMVAVHGINCFRCGYCKTEYKVKEELLDHVVTCTAKKRKRKADTNKRKELIVECDVCNKSMQKASLRLHKEVKHAGMGPVCEHCGRRFGNKFRLSEHLRAKHGYEKFKCSMCDFLSASSTAVRNHERRHRGEKPFVCEQCGAKFHASHLLAQHKQSHRTEKNMKCDQCPAAFKANNALHMHKMTCHNTNSYQCPMCPRTFRSRHYAVKHLRSVHRHAGAVGALLVAPRERQPVNDPVNGGLDT